MKNLAEKYLEFLEAIGDCEIEKIAKIIPFYTDTKIKKILNGNLECSTQTELATQLSEVRRVVGKCSFDLLDSFSDQSQNKAVIKYQLNSEHSGSFLTIAILKFNQDKNVSVIDEVYIPLK